MEELIKKVFKYILTILIAVIVTKIYTLNTLKIDNIVVNGEQVNNATVTIKCARQNLNYYYQIDN